MIPRTATTTIGNARISLASLAVLALSISSSQRTAVVHAQDAIMPTMCSCSPTVFTFVLNLSGSCDVNDIEANPGIEGSFCFLEEGVALPAPPGTAELEQAEAEIAATVCSFCPDDGGLVDPNFVLPTDAGTTCGQAAELAASLGPEDENCATVQLAEQLCCVTSAAEGGSEVKEAAADDDDDADADDDDDDADAADATTDTETAATEAAVVATRPALTTEPVRRHRRRIQEEVEVEVTSETTGEEEEEVDPNAVVEILSVQFLEFDTSGDLTVINQDDTYADVSLADGDRLKFHSASSFLDTSLPLEEQTSNPALVPGGASLILYGKTASGEIVRNRFFWMYDMNCGRENEPIKSGDKIGWVKVAGARTSGPWPAFCPAQPDSPTISPKTNEPTLSPSVSPIASPTTSPIASPTTSPIMMSMRTPTTEAPVTPSPTSGGSKITPHPTKPPSSDWNGGGDGVFISKSGKVPKTYKPKHPSTSSKSSKSSDSKSGKGAKGAKSHRSSSGSHDVAGKTVKDVLPDGYNMYNMNERLTEYDVSRLNNAATPLSSSVRGLGLVASSLMAAILLLARQ